MSNPKFHTVRCYQLRVNGQVVHFCYARSTHAAIQRFYDAGFGDVVQKDGEVTASDIAYEIPEDEL